MSAAGLTQPLIPVLLRRITGTQGPRCQTMGSGTTVVPSFSSENTKRQMDPHAYEEMSSCPLR